ncbi:uncharacterized protein LOC124337825 [Daphnia pulicaria]|uniref:uncharacterized protein LOC124337825 n=1 Tax=Daphnia pulicaria TaxID=35523 RepID=UPI001EEC609A|nr:uncharacterized protein LOC124337825 [Daphnia pulicaria]
MAVTETWLSTNEELLSICPDGFTAVHKPRGGPTKGGGIALLYRDSIRLTQRQNTTFSSFEYMDVSFSVKSTTIRQVIIYRPPKESKAVFIEQFSELLEMIIVSEEKLLITGDFNINMLGGESQDVYSRGLSDLFESFGLVQHVSQVTHIRGGVIDLVLSRKSDNLILSAEVGGLFSDHFAIECVLRLSRPILPTKKISYRPFKTIDYEAFAEDVAKLPFVCEPAESCDELVRQYNSGIISCLDKQLPPRSKTIVVRPLNPWFNDEIKAARRSSRAAERRWRSRQLEIDKQILCGMRDRLSEAIRTAKISYYSSRKSECGKDQRALFKVVNRMLGRQRGLTLPSHESLNAILNQFGAYWTDGAVNEREFPDDQEQSEGLQMEEFTPVSVEDVALTIVELKQALIPPLLKKSTLNPELLSSYRPVSNLPFIGKLLERIAVKRLNVHLTDGGRMAPTQSAYRVYHSTETALVKVVNDLLMAADGGYGSVLMLLDLSAAFDTVDHTALLERLKNRFSITGSALQWFQSYLSERTQSVSVCGVKSEPLPLMSGVPQGSVLGPTIFTAHLSPVHDVVSRHEINLHTYADDNELYTSFNLLKGDQSDQKYCQNQEISGHQRNTDAGTSADDIDYRLLQRSTSRPARECDWKAAESTKFSG